MLLASAKPVWVTGLGVPVALDCGSGKVALVDGVLGTQKPGGLNWDTDAAWTEADIAQHVAALSTLCPSERTAATPTIAYGTGNWRKPHMATVWPLFKTALAVENIDFNLLPGALEAKYVR